MKRILRQIKIASVLGRQNTGKESLLVVSLELPEDAGSILEGVADNKRALVTAPCMVWEFSLVSARESSVV